MLAEWAALSINHLSMTEPNFDLLTSRIHPLSCSCLRPYRFQNLTEHFGVRKSPGGRKCGREEILLRRQHVRWRMNDVLADVVRPSSIERGIRSYSFKCGSGYRG